MTPITDNSEMPNSETFKKRFLAISPKDYLDKQ